MNEKLEHIILQGGIVNGRLAITSDDINRILVIEYGQNDYYLRTEERVSIGDKNYIVFKVEAK
jgi:hypothetical protein